MEAEALYEKVEPLSARIIRLLDEMEEQISKR
jgi:hypothetical protein